MRCPPSVVRRPLSFWGKPSLDGGIKVAQSDFEKLEVYQLAERLADAVWDVTARWNNFSRDTVGKQLVRAADSIGANVAEGTGRRSFQDNRRFVRIARGSLYESKHWLRRAYKRDLLSEDQVNSLKPLLDELAPRLNAYLRSIGPKATTDNGPRTTDN